ncbi:BRCA1-associated protein 2-domain-containing protein [Limtongia smithiae]|uniref:BRCA1-associated protein 2-domain-containing protein n=1 Tax=Limtongia smithiae TaxID=1125753 RepID=UPI0034CF35F8
MRVRFHIVIDILPQSLEVAICPAVDDDGWVARVVQSGSVFEPVCPATDESEHQDKTRECVEGVGVDKSIADRFTRIDARFGRVEILGVDLSGEEDRSNSDEATEHTVSEYSGEVSEDSMSRRTVDMKKKVSAPAAATAAVAATPSTTASSPVPPQPPMRRSSVFQSPRARFMGSGVIHLFHEGEESASSTVTHASSSSAVATDSESGSTVLAILAVPGYMTASDLLGFVGKETRASVSHFRMLKTTAMNRYMVLMKFREQSDADRFYSRFNCKAFNSLEPETCHVVYIHSIRFHKSSFPEFPYFLDDEFTPLADYQDKSEKSAAAASVVAAAVVATGSSVSGPTGGRGRAASMVIAKPAPPPTRALRELPTCPVCLERMDSSTTGLLTIICQHTFHCQCLSKWGDNSCPVCRYSQKKDHQSQMNDPNQCSACGAVQNLWICLICGNIGCGRYDDAHAFQHYMESGHVYAMDIESQRVWDYAGDGYVHRLIQNQSDGKLVELPSVGGSSTLYRADLDEDEEDMLDEDGEYVPREKVESIGMEYTYLLTSQLESQRAYFEDRISAVADKASAALQRAERAEREAAELAKNLQHATARNEEFAKSLVPSLESQQERAKRKVETLQALSQKLEKEWREEKSMNESMMKKIEFLNNEKTQRDREIEDLREQLRDVMLYLDAQQKFHDMDEEVQQGTVTVAEGASTPKKNRKGRGKK